MLSFTDRLNKEIKGSLNALLILLIIQKSKKTWGYHIKQTLKILMGESIQNSSLYTILRNLESNYGLLKSEMHERRRYYSLTDKGIQETQDAVQYWLNMHKKSLKIFKNFDINFVSKIKQV